ncbi:DUF6456 domain-containing protein [Oharaeibacter diazotrophicus]|uniref:DUF6456 domain-containing protein n=2 Tax=Oharaeibacter diazotrophicus TaxID=1920512 RepID=A0A4R6RB60_9HYPH|nr:DUF6456 domain-containing protein [Oharaeibacter diazotrophicus]TDP83254.1 hypothetical protein EDD54_3213 [Oharaeibacter diazotrophicus]BBE72087.1 hypothetical protein OHA_1_01674 [Pleomorphomonas sp. SM30]GLS78852.1 hypothetical protein GCM10007904_41890 [Oharaeibacter diazotrophicus]
MSAAAPRRPAPRRDAAPGDDVDPASELPGFDAAESPLGWLRSRRDRDGASLIGDAEFVAGERFRRDYTIGGLIARTTMNWDALGGPAERRRGGAGGALVVGEAAMAARDRVAAAVAAVGPEFASLLIDVCCHLKGLGDIERDRAWPARSGKVVLRLALAALARHYGLSDRAVGADRARTRSWGAPDYKPRA